MSESNTKELLNEMAKLTTMSNRISTVQEKNMKMFGLVFFNGVKAEDLQIKYDLSHKADIIEDEINNKLIINTPTRNSYVAYYYSDIDESVNPEIEKRYLALEKSVRTLFWNDVKVEVYFNNKIKYKSAD